MEHKISERVSMSEKILLIEETVEKGEYRDMVGYRILTDKQDIKILISDGQACCENSGYFATYDNFSDFIGAEIRGIKLTDTCLNQKVVEAHCPDWLDLDEGGGGIQFVDIDTDKGTLQFAVYNSQNGYYGHAIEITSNQVTLEGCL